MKNCEMYVSRCSERLRLSPSLSLSFSLSVRGFLYWPTYRVFPPSCGVPSSNFAISRKNDTIQRAKFIITSFFVLSASCGRFHSWPPQLLNFLSSSLAFHHYLVPAEPTFPLLGFYPFRVYNRLETCLRLRCKFLCQLDLRVVFSPGHSSILAFSHLQGRKLSVIEMKMRVLIELVFKDPY